MEPASYDLRMITLDSALEYTGWCVYYVSTGNFSYRMMRLGLITTEANLPVDMRIRTILSEISKIWHEFKVNCTLIECPPLTCYGSQMMSKDAIIGRMTSVCKVFAASHAILGMCYAHGMYHRMVEPKQWQPHFPKAGMSKPWSLREANKQIAALKYPYKKLKTKEDANIADAINLGAKAMVKYYHKDWALPDLGETNVRNK